MIALHIGQLGEIGNLWFRVLGRLRYEGEDSEWDEWCLELHDKSIGWLEQEEGQTILMRKKKLTTPVPPFDQVRVGMTLNVNGLNFFVVERNRARIIEAEGDIPFPVNIGQSALFVDGNISGQPAVVEYGDDAIEYGIGEILERGHIISDALM